MLRTNRSVWPQRPLCGRPGMGLRNRCAAVLGWWVLSGETLVRQSWDGGSYCGVWPQIPTCDSPGMVGVTVVCGIRDPSVAVLGWWVLCGLRYPRVTDLDTHV